MAWDTARTRQLLLDAAVQEYAQYGPVGARMDRIASSAGVNKERIYQYFGNKEQFFGVVLDQELGRLAAAVPLTAELADDLGEYAGRVYDYHAEHPHLVRLMQWEGLQTGDEPVPAEADRTRYYAGKVTALAQAQARGTIAAGEDPAYLLYAVVALTVWWFSVPQIVRMMTAGSDTDSPADRRAALTALVRRIAG
ncbi:TetR family transcriptional regulator [Actinocatenispora thailandica]|uniref:TetR family transcriptional regulator n=1 Tax=Actinocatenispora thailandica TaxID=227318 RepID=A0A7R7DSB1_9ACTN|nr:TetR family transcriptional regulator [Actinocatenispora thailandica]BCJ36826.1 TetR family transcriptional regulator [Actinocatenispora thailandica]